MEERASAATFTPAVMHPPMYSPLAFKASRVVAVPKSSTTQGAPYRAMAATQATDRSGPRCSSLSTPSFSPASASSTMMMGSLPKYFIMALARVCMMVGTTEAMMTSSTSSGSSPKRRK